MISKGSMKENKQKPGTLISVPLPKGGFAFYRTRPGLKERFQWLRKFRETLPFPLGSDKPKADENSNPKP